jgi:hypothetical protein
VRRIAVVARAVVLTGIERLFSKGRGARETRTDATAGASTNLVENSGRSTRSATVAPSSSATASSTHVATGLGRQAEVATRWRPGRTMCSAHNVS